MILAKSCHDMDIIRYLMGERCVRVSSFGRLGHFTEANAPQGSAGAAWTAGAPKAQCPYDAEKIYLTNPLTGLLHGNSGWPVSVLVARAHRGERAQSPARGALWPLRIPLR